ncbi:MAG: hypothetical protein FWH29_06250 [Methanobrevibacter sp.]|nr:hypothetical protein [Methanobrevibacter sp.]
MIHRIKNKDKLEKDSESTYDAYNEGMEFLNKGFPVKAIKKFEIAEKLAKKSDNNEDLYNILITHVGTLIQEVIKKNNPPYLQKADKLNQKAMKINEDRLLDEISFMCYRDKGIICYYQLKMDESLKWYKKAIKIAKKYNDSLIVEAIEHDLKKVEEIIKQDEVSESMFQSFKKAMEYLDNGNLDKALDLVEVAEILARKLGNNEDLYNFLIMHINILIQVYLSKTNPSYLEKADKLNEETMKIDEKREVSENSFLCYRDKGIICFYQLKMDESLKWYKKALKIAKKYNDNLTVEAIEQNIKLVKEYL